MADGWAVICFVTADGEQFAVKRVNEHFLQSYLDCGWNLVIGDSQMRSSAKDIEDVRKDEERGRR
jgi:hypothetical protein